MPDLTQKDLHIDAALSQVSIRFQNQMYVAERMMPRVRVGKESDKYFVYDKSNLRADDSLRADGSAAKEVSFSLSQDSYQVEEFALRQLVTDRQMRNADSPLDPKTDATMHLTDKIWLDLEKDVADVLRDPLVLTQGVTLAGPSQWSAAGSDPIGDIRTGIDTIRQAAVKDPNTILIPRAVWTQLQDHADVIERIKHTQLGVATEQLFGQMVGLNVVIGHAIENTANEGQADALADVWGKDVIIAHVAPSPAPRSQSLGYLFSTMDRQARSWREEARRGDWVEVSDFYDVKVVSAADGYLIQDAVA